MGRLAIVEEESGREGCGSGSGTTEMSPAHQQPPAVQVAQVTVASNAAGSSISRPKLSKDKRTNTKLSEEKRSKGCSDESGFFEERSDSVEIVYDRKEALLNNNNSKSGSSTNLVKIEGVAAATAADGGDQRRQPLQEGGSDQRCDRNVEHQGRPESERAGERGRGGFRMRNRTFLNVSNDASSVCICSIVVVDASIVL